MYDRITVLKNDDGHLELQECGGEWLVHLQLYRWSLSKYKEYLATFKGVLEMLHSEGVERVFVVIPNDPKLIRFEKMFGFEQLPVEGEHVVMYRKTGE